MTAKQLVEWRIRLFGHKDKLEAAKALGISVKKYAAYERGTINGMHRSVPRLVELACWAIEAGLHVRRSNDVPEGETALEIGVRAAICLKNADIALTVASLSSISDRELMGIPGMGKRTINEIRKAVLKARSP